MRYCAINITILVLGRVWIIFNILRKDILDNIFNGKYELYIDTRTRRSVIFLYFNFFVWNVRKFFNRQKCYLIIYRMIHLILILKKISFKFLINSAITNLLKLYIWFVKKLLDSLLIFISPKAINLDVKSLYYSYNSYLRGRNFK